MITFNYLYADLKTNSAEIWKQGSSKEWKTVESKNGLYIGVPVMVTYDNSRFVVAVQGEPDFTLTYDDTSPLQPSWLVSFYTGTNTEVELSFTEPCIIDFDPEFTPQ